MWGDFLACHNGKQIISLRQSVCASTLNMCSDSSLTGFGATFGAHYLVGRFPDAWKDLGIQLLELYPIYLVLEVFASDLANKRVVVSCDNSSVVAALNSLTSRNANLMKLLRRVVLTLLRNNISVHAVHVPGRLNLICDALSRQVIPWDLLRQGVTIATLGRSPRTSCRGASRSNKRSGGPLL